MVATPPADAEGVVNATARAGIGPTEFLDVTRQSTTSLRRRYGELPRPTQTRVESTVGFPYNTSEKGELVSIYPPSFEAKLTEMVYNVVGIWDAKTWKEYVNPISVETKAGEPASLLEVVGAAKLEAKVWVGPPVSIQVILQSINEPTKA